MGYNKTLLHKMTKYPHEEVFSVVYKYGFWGDGSGNGSTELYTRQYRKFLEKWMKENEIKSVMDLGCGNWSFSKLMDWKGIDYFGVDCVKDIVENNIKEYTKENINFLHLDISCNCDKLPRGKDLVIMKDVLQHWTNEEIITFMDCLTHMGHKNIMIVNGVKGKGVCIGEDRELRNTYRFAKLDCSMYPLKRYNPEVIYTFRHKEVGLIQQGSPKKSKIDSPRPL